LGGSLNCSDAHLCVLVGVCWLSNVETSGGERWGDLIVGLGGLENDEMMVDSLALRTLLSSFCNVADNEIGLKSPQFSVGGSVLD
jgi:hypothetical protein